MTFESASFIWPLVFVKLLKMTSNQSEVEPKVKMFNCKQCNVKPFTQKSHLNSHMKLKHSEKSGKRECVRCTSAFSQINNFVVHYKTKHLNKKCEQCRDTNLCTLCNLDLTSAKVEWQLKPLEVESPEFESVGGHICEVCKMSFRKKFHLNTHIKLKHDDSSCPGVCTKCPVSFAQMNNFVVHFKKNHLNKDCVCNTEKLCDNCTQYIVEAKQLWLLNKTESIKAKSSERPKPTNAATLAQLQTTSISAPTLAPFIAATPPSPPPTTDSLASTSTFTHFHAIDSSDKLNVFFECVRCKCLFGQVQMNSQCDQCNAKTLRATCDLELKETDTGFEFTPFHLDSPNYDPIKDESNAKPLYVDHETESVSERSVEFIVENFEQDHRKTKSILDRSIESLVAGVVPNSDDSQNVIPVKCEIEGDEIVPLLVSPLPEKLHLKRLITHEEQIPAKASRIVTIRNFETTEKIIYDQILAKVKSTQASSELKYIKNQAESKHLLRANVELVNREAAKTHLDTKFIKKFKDVEKDWILVTYIRNNKNIKSTEYAQVCKEIGVDEKRIKKLLEYQISCDEALGLYPRVYLQLKSEFKTQGSNTEV